MTSGSPRAAPFASAGACYVEKRALVMLGVRPVRGVHVTGAEPMKRAAEPQPTTATDTAELLDGAATTAHGEWLRRIAKLSLGEAGGTNGVRVRPGFVLADDSTAELEAEERAANAARLRIATGGITLLWITTGVQDWMSTVLFDSDVGALWLARILSTPPLLLLFVLLGQPERHDPRLLRALDVGAYATITAALGWMSGELGGLSSPYKQGVYLVVMCRGAFLSSHWRSGWQPYAVIVPAYFVAQLAASLRYEGLAQQLRSPAGLVWVTGSFTAMASAAILMVLASHSAWALRRRAAEARRLGKYQLIEQIGEGGHGTVWRAYHPGLRGEVAIKMLRGRFAPDSLAVARFEREVSATVSLKHPNTVRLFDYGVSEDGVYYIAMELLTGKTLASVVAQEGRMPATQALAITRQVVGALAEAHRLGIVHRDVKPENIFLTDSSTPADFAKLLDFGIAGGDLAAENLTRTGIVLGTPGYIAPEVLKGHVADARADVFAVGTVLRFALIGKRPVGESEEAQNESSDGEVPAALRHVVQRCLRTDPDERYPDAVALAEALRECDRALSEGTSR